MAADQSFGLSVKLDRIDRAILNALQQDARSSFIDIANKLNLSESTVRFRFKRLLEQGVITKLVAILDPRKIGYPLIALFFLKLDPALFEDAIKQLAAMEEIDHLFQHTGEHNVLAMAHLRGTDQLNDLAHRIQLIEGVRDSVVTIVTNVIKVQTGFKL